jgi:hypothetical protein
LCQLTSADKAGAACNQWINPRSCRANHSGMVGRGYSIVTCRRPRRTTRAAGRSTAGARSARRWPGSRPRPPPPARAAGRCLEGNIHRVGPKVAYRPSGLAENLYKSLRELELTRIMGQPCGFQVWEKQAVSARGFKRVGRLPEYAIQTVWRCVRRGPGGSSEPPEPRICCSLVVARLQQHNRDGRGRRQLRTYGTL